MCARLQDYKRTFSFLSMLFFDNVLYRDTSRKEASYIRTVTSWVLVNLLLYVLPQRDNRPYIARV